MLVDPHQQLIAVIVPSKSGFLCFVTWETVDDVNKWVHVVIDKFYLIGPKYYAVHAIIEKSYSLLH